MAFIGFSFAVTGVGKGLARISSGDDVHGWDGCPVHGCDVAVVGHVWVVVGENPAGCFVPFAVPSNFGIEDLTDGLIEPAVAGE